MSSIEPQQDELKQKVRRLLSILDIREESSNGRVFAPIQITSVRVQLTAELKKLFEELKELTNYERLTPSK